MARPMLRKNAEIDSPHPGVPSVSPETRIPIYPVQVIKGGVNWSLDGLEDHDLFPSPHSLNNLWAEGWVAYRTRSAMLDHPKIYQNINFWKSQVMSAGPRWIPCINPYGPDKSYFEEAARYANFMEALWRGVRGNAWSIRREMLDCIHTGNKVAAFSSREQETGRFKGKWVLDFLNVWPNGNYGFYRNEFGDTTEIRVNNGRLTSLGVPDQFRYPREKFMVMSFRPINNNPYGTTILRPVYDPFYDDIQARFELDSYMSTWGRPSVIIFAAPPPEHMKEVPFALKWRDGAPVLEEDPDNPGQLRQRYGYQTEQNQLMFTDFQAGSVWSLAGGSKVQVAEPRAGGAELFKDVRDRAARYIAGVILGTHQATESESNISSGNQQVGEGILGANVSEGRRMLEEAEENDIARYFITANFGDAAADLLPICDYGSRQNGRVNLNLNANVTFASNGAMTRAQYWDMCVANGQPLPWPDDKPVIASLGELQAKQNPGGGADKDPTTDPNHDPSGDKTKAKK